jgi:glycosyltransferase involved in cell wall biosynthesis
MLGRAERAYPAAGANTFRVVELRSPYPDARVLPPKAAKLQETQTLAPASAPLPTAQNKVAILLCTFQGQAFLEEQLMSFQAQNHKNWVLHVSDDGSSDDTRHILHRYQVLLGSNKMSVNQGPQQGFVANFLSLVMGQDARADHYAYSDQDDVWEADKLARAVAWLQTIAPDVPALYCSRTRIVDAHGVSIGLSPLFEKPPSFANAIVQNIGGGNTMVFNEAARQLIAQTVKEAQVVSHDWWAYLLVSACGGAVRYDPYPGVRYRQHANNLVGSNNSWLARLFRMRMLVQGRFKVWNDKNIEALQSVDHLMTPQNRHILQLFSQAREQSVWRRLLSLKRSGVRRQTWFSQISLFAAALFGKL